jgi:hypothetical protein
MTMQSYSQGCTANDIVTVVAVAAAYTLFTLSAAQTDRYKKVKQQRSPSAALLPRLLLAVVAVAVVLLDK